MLVYHVRWSYDTDLGKGTGKKKFHDQFLDVLVLCRNSHQALSTLQWLFLQKHLDDGFSIDDGIITCKRCAVDSRNIIVQYLMLEGMKEPLNLVDIPSNSRRLSNIFQIPTFY